MCITHCVTGFMFMGRIMTVKQGNCQGSVVTKFTVSKASRAPLLVFLTLLQFEQRKGKFYNDFLQNPPHHLRCR